MTWPTTSEPMDALTIERRFLILRASRWFPTGLLIPVLILYLLDIGLSLSQIGVVAAAQGVAVMLLELPTGGLADAVGRRRVLLLANLFELVALGLLLNARSVSLIALAFMLWGVFRALESGPLDAWFVDAVHQTLKGIASDHPNMPDNRADSAVESGLRRAGVALGLAIAAGSVASGVVVAVSGAVGWNPLAAPIVLALILRIFDTGLILRLMVDVRAPLNVGALKDSMVTAPRIVFSAFGLLRRSRLLAALVLIEAFWGFGMVSFETLFPPRLAELFKSEEQAALVLGPVAAAGWIASSAGAYATGRLTRRLGRQRAAAAMRVAHGVTVVGIALAAGPSVAILSYLLCFVVHGAANPVHQTILHSVGTSSNRATIVSLNSLAASMFGAIGGIVLGLIAERSGLGVAMLVGAVCLAVAAPLYLVNPDRSTRNAVKAEIPA